MISDHSRNYLQKIIKEERYGISAAAWKARDRKNILYTLPGFFTEKKCDLSSSKHGKRNFKSGLISILLENPNSIFVIEDAENIIVDREKDRHCPVSALLNISDGLLSDCLNIQVICSFNTDISKVDGAIMRKGRLIAKYEFKELEIGGRPNGYPINLDSLQL